MRTLPTALQDALDSGASTLATCWVVTRRDGVVWGGTDHDRDLTIMVEGAPVTCRAEAALGASEAERTLGLDIDAAEITGALADARIDEDDIIAGLWDGARVEAWRVDWTDASTLARIDSWALGEITRMRNSFRAELRGLAHRVRQPRGRVYGRLCDAELGDARCGVGLGPFTYAGTVATVAGPRSLTLAGAAAGASDGLFARGVITWTSGANDGRSGRVKRHLVDGDATIELWEAPPAAIAVADGFSLVAGCDKTIGTCGGTFSNAVNHRGFAHIPGPEILAVPDAGDPRNDGSSLWSAS